VVLNSFIQSFFYIKIKNLKTNHFLYRSEENHDCIPRVLLFFVNFLLRSRVFPHLEQHLHRSLEVIELAKIELPLTMKIGKTFPDKFSQACNTCWGNKRDYYEIPTVDDNSLEEPKRKRQKMWGSVAVDDWGAAGGWGQDVDVKDENSGWALLPVDKPESLPSLPSLLGSTGTVLPLTHSTGIVERSMRRIISVTPPSPPSSDEKSPPFLDGKPNARGVENQLDRNFAKVVLAPMIDGWDGGEAAAYTKAVILKTSQGGPQPHNPETDEITLLVESNIDYLREGMGIEGTWVQLVRKEDRDVNATIKGKSKDSSSSYWYLDEFVFVVPSFWAFTASPVKKL
jgi:hypothetical protein